jgi:hypothetical protein
VQNIKSATGRNQMTANEEVVSKQIARGPAINELSTKEPKETYEAAATTNQWNCDFSCGSSDSSSVSCMEVGTSNPDFRNKESTDCDHSQLTILQDGSSKCIGDARRVVINKMPFQNRKDKSGNTNCALTTTSILQSASAASSTSSSSSDDGSVSSSSSDSGSNAISSSSSSSSDSSSSSSSSSTG